MSTKIDMVEELYADWDYVINEYLDVFRDIFIKDMMEMKYSEIKRELIKNRKQNKENEKWCV